MMHEENVGEKNRSKIISAVLKENEMWKNVLIGIKEIDFPSILMYIHKS